MRPRGPTQGEEFEREYKKKVTAGPRYSPFGSCDAEEKSLQAWVEDLLTTARAQDRQKEAKERQSMGQEDSNSQLPKTMGMGEDVGTASFRPITVSCTRKLS